MLLSDKTIDRLLPGPLPTIEEIEKKYPPRNLPEGARVSRQGPSPTGYMHIGLLYASLISDRFVHQNTSGIFFLRIEDTDTKREKAGAADVIRWGLGYFGIQLDEGSISDAEDRGIYGPYVQSRRAPIYKAFVKKWLKEGKAYPSFLSEEEIEEIRKAQTYENIRPGLYGKWAVGRNITEAEINEKLDKGMTPAIYFRSPGDENKRIKVTDLLKGEREFPEWDLDFPILKSDGLPTYHFAHMIDDHLMGTTHVIRGDEWFSSLPRHIQLFQAMGWKTPKYAHISPILKLDKGARRKISKRTDPEADLTLYVKKGYPKEAILEYLMNLANSNFEDWRKVNPQKKFEEFEFSFKKMNDSGALLDLVKLDNVSKNVVARFSAEEIYAKSYEWAKTYDAKLKALMDSNPAYVQKILGIERTPPKVRKDITTWSDLYGELSYFFDEHFSLSKPDALGILKEFDPETLRKIVRDFSASYDPSDNKDAWFEKVKKIAGAHGYATDMKAFQADPKKHKGSISDVAKVFRVLLTGKVQTPDLHSVMKVMGKERCLRRLALLD